MRNIYFALSLIFILALTSCNEGAENSAEKKHIEPVKQARMLYIHDDSEFSWPGFPVMDSIAILKNKYITVEKIHVDSVPGIIDSLGLKYIPHIIVIDTLGNIIYNRPGQYSYGELNRMLKGKVW